MDEEPSFVEVRQCVRCGQPYDAEFQDWEPPPSTLCRECWRNLAESRLRNNKPDNEEVDF